MRWTDRLLDVVYYGSLLAALAWIAVGIAACARGGEPPPAAPPQLVIDCRIVDVYDGDTLSVEIVLRSRVRLRDCWAPEIAGRGVTPAEKERGLAARDHLRETIGPLPAPARLVIPLGAAQTVGELFSFDRLLGDVFAGPPDRLRSLAETQIEAGHATRDRR